jgi:hypothetical protein
MARGLVFALTFVGLVSVVAEGAGCTSTGTTTSTNEGGSNACIGDASIKLVQASDYDQSCTVDTDCQQIAEGNACVSCAFGCPVGGAINVSALTQYNADIANTPAVGQGCPALPCVATEFPCCIGGKCQVGNQCSNPTPTDAAAETGAEADATACAVDSSEVACCCDGDVGGKGPFCSGGSLSCATGFGLYFGADCTRECGPCAVACPDSGTSGADAARDGAAADASGE